MSPPKARCCASHHHQHSSTENSTWHQGSRCRSSSTCGGKVIKMLQIQSSRSRSERARDKQNPFPAPSLSAQNSPFVVFRVSYRSCHRPFRPGGALSRPKTTILYMYKAMQTTEQEPGQTLSRENKYNKFKCEGFFVLEGPIQAQSWRPGHRGRSHGEQRRPYRRPSN